MKIDEQKQCAKEILDYIKACEIDGQEPDHRDIVVILNKHFGYNPVSNENINQPTVYHLWDYLNYQYPSTQGTSNFANYANGLRKEYSPKLKINDKVNNEYFSPPRRLL